MKTAFIGVDPSIVSTAVCVDIDQTEFFLNFTSETKRGKWHKLLDGVTVFETVYYPVIKEYSESELSKLRTYEKTTNSIIIAIKKLLNNVDEVHINIEGYSYSSAAGPLIDLVTFGALLRHNLVNLASMYSVRSTVTITAPMTLKGDTCKVAYGIQDKKNKKMYRNLSGVAGGSFKKREMLESMFYYCETGWSSALYVPLHSERDTLLEAKAIPKPIDDIVDAFWLKETRKRNRLG